MENKKPLLPEDRAEMEIIFKQLGKNYKSMDEKCSYYRGRFIHSVTSLETFIDDILTLYFCPDNKVKQEELLYMLLSTEKVTLSGKYNLLSFIIHNHFQWFYDKHTPQIVKKKKNELPPDSLDTQVYKVIELRNKFAHRKIAQTLDSLIKFDGDNISLDLKTGKYNKIIPKDLCNRKITM